MRLVGQPTLRFYASSGPMEKSMRVSSTRHSLRRKQGPIDLRVSLRPAPISSLEGKAKGGGQGVSIGSGGQPALSSRVALVGSEARR
jgi:hypothetical protein